MFKKITEKSWFIAGEIFVSRRNKYAPQHDNPVFDRHETGIINNEAAPLEEGLLLQKDFKILLLHHKVEHTILIA